MDVLFWVSLAVVIVASFAYRVYINRGQTKGVPDEKRYSIYAYTWRPGKRYKKEVDEFLGMPGLEIPPTRFGFFGVCALASFGRKEWTQCFKPVTWVAAVSAALTAPVSYFITEDLPSSLLVASSPLSLFLSRRALQDSFTALLMLLGVWAIHLANPWLLGISVVLALISREAMVLYLPALAAAWAVRTGVPYWFSGALALTLGTLGAIAAFYAVGGRRLIDIFKKLQQSTDYVRRFQSGMPHRMLVDMALVSPVVTLAVLANWSAGPLWLVTFAGIALLTHSGITPKNIRFLLVVDISARMLCASLPGPWPWVVLVAGSIADFYLYRAFGKVEDPVTANLVVKSGMYLEK